MAVCAWTLPAHADDDLWKRDKLTGDWGGARTELEKRGIDLSLVYIGEALDVASGGVSRGGTYEGRLDFTVTTDWEKLFGWTGAKAQVRAFQIHNVGHLNAADRVGSIADPSNIDAFNTTRLFTAWFQQEFGKVASIRVGQLAADDEFITSTTAGGLINGTFGWPGWTAANLPSGGPAYPLATPGVRLQVNPTDTISLLGAVFSGDPAGANCNDIPQKCNRYGTTFSFSGGAFWIGEAQYQVNQEKDAKGLAAAYKIGAWYHSGKFADERFGIDATGMTVPLATDPDDTLNHTGNWGVYGVLDQMIARGAESSTSVFLRGGVSPSDRNLVSWYLDGGVGFKGLLPGRADDTLTFGAAYISISKDAAAADQDVLALNGPPYPTRSNETVFEVSYVAQIAPWWSIQPDLQYIARPGGGVPDPVDPSRTVGNALVVGVRTTITF
jgi:porin